MKNKILTYTRTLLFFTLAIFAIACSSDESKSKETPVSFNPTPSFTPSESDSLSELVVNTFAQNGIDITTSPTFVDFNSNHSKIDQNDELLEAVTIHNHSGASRHFDFRVLSVSSGFSVLNSDKEHMGGLKPIVVENGDSATFYIKFNAWLFGSHTSFVTISADIDGYIQMPVRAVVSGATQFRLIPSAYFCTDNKAPSVDVLDFHKVASYQTKTHGIKLCNTGGNNIAIHTAKIETSDTTQLSEALESNVFEEFMWSVSDEINSSFAFGTEPVQTQTFTEPTTVNYPGSVTNPTTSYSVNVNQTQESVAGIIIEAGKLLTLDVNFTPDLDQEAPAGTKYAAEPVNANLNLKTSIGSINIPLLGASSGIEPILDLSYRYSEAEAWRPIDLTSNGAALYFGTVNIFLDWVSNNSKVAEVLITNTGSGSKNLDYFGGSLNGFYEYYWADGETPLTFPISLAAGESRSFKIRYVPQAASELDETFEANWNFGQLYMQHTGGNGPQNKITLVGEQDSGFAVELKHGGTFLQREYSGNQFLSLCALRIDPQNPSEKTFRVVNNSNIDQMQVNWSVSPNPDELTVNGPASGSFEIAPNTYEDFKVNFVANADRVGETVGGILNVQTTYPDQEANYASLISNLNYDREFTVPFKAQASETGESSRCGGGVLGLDGPTKVTFVMDRILMAMAPSLIETARNPNAFKFHFGLMLDAPNNRVWIEKETPLVFDKTDPNFSPIHQIRSYVHQATNIRGCFALPSNPYRLEFEKGSWTGEGFECADQGLGTISYSSPEGDTFTIDSDTACMDNNGAENITDSSGTEWTVIYHDFVKFNDCNVKFYGKISTFAFRPQVEKLYEVLQRAEETPNESESFYEQLYGAYQYDSEVIFLEDTECGDVLYPAGTSLRGNPDAIKTFYQCIANDKTSKRALGYIDECSYFNFSVDAGIEPSQEDLENNNFDNWQGYGVYEPHLDDEGTLHATKYDMTIYNIHMRAFVLGAGDRSNFFGHAGHLIYSDIYATLTTKRLADEGSDEDGTWQDRIAVNSRRHFDKNQIFLEDGNPLEIKKYWTEDGVSSEFSNVIDDSGIERGIDQGGYGKGNFRYIDGSTNKIIPSGWPINFDENNLFVAQALGSFTGKGDTAPSFAKADSATGRGKSLYFTFHGCLIEGVPDASVGCFDYQRDNTTMLDDPTRLVIDEYVDAGILPNGYVENSSECQKLEDAGFEDRMNYEYMSCINFKIFPRDYDRMTDYFNESGRFEYDDNSYYTSSSKCGIGM